MLAIVRIALSRPYTFAAVGADNRVVLKPVSIGRDLGSLIELASGLLPEDRWPASISCSRSAADGRIPQARMVQELDFALDDFSDWNSMGAGEAAPSEQFSNRPGEGHPILVTGTLGHYGHAPI
jgi:hypothetical protein